MWRCGAQVPESGKIYAFNEGNYCAWDQGLKDYINSLKDGSNFHGQPYSARCAPLSLCTQTTRSVERLAEACVLHGLALLEPPNSAHAALHTALRRALHTAPSGKASSPCFQGDNVALKMATAGPEKGPCFRISGTCTCSDLITSGMAFHCHFSCKPSWLLKGSWLSRESWLIQVHWVAGG